MSPLQKDKYSKSYISVVIHKLTAYILVWGDRQNRTGWDSVKVAIANTTAKAKI